MLPKLMALHNDPTKKINSSHKFIKFRFLHARPVVHSLNTFKNKMNILWQDFNHHKSNPNSHSNFPNKHQHYQPASLSLPVTKPLFLLCLFFSYFSFHYYIHICKNNRITSYSTASIIATFSSSFSSRLFFFFLLLCFVIIYNGQG